MIEHAYIHFPFCIRKCHYCSFVSGFNIGEKAPYIESLLSEIKQRYRQECLKTIYFGGGTPSLLEPTELYNILNYFKFDEHTEITIEVNPETANLKKLQELKEIGFNRNKSFFFEKE